MILAIALSGWLSDAALAETPADFTSRPLPGGTDGIVAVTDATATTDLTACFPRIRDYSLMWWADGFQGRSSTGQWNRAIQTGQYAFVLDVERMAVTHVGTLGDSLSYADAARQGNAAWSQLPPAQLDLEIRVGGMTYRCTRGGPALDHDGPRIIESGRFVQRADVTGLVFESQEGQALRAESRFETCAWPDHLALLLEAFDPSGTALDRRPTVDWTNAALTVRLTTADARFEKSVSQPADHVWTADDPGRVAVALDFGGSVPKQVSCESETSDPDLNVVATDVHTGTAVPVLSDPVRGWLRVNLDGISKQGDVHDRIERVRLRLQNRTDQEQPVRLLFDKTQDLPITGMSAMLRDPSGFPTGIPVQLSKNWHRSEQRRLVYEGPWFHGFTFLRLPPCADMELELVLSGAHWGGVAAASHAQLCLVGWGSNQLWDQTAMGSWGENLCFEADRAQASALVCDVRPLMVHAMNSDVPTKWSWTNNVGGGDAFRLFAKDGSYVRPVRMKTAYLRHGPCLTDVRYCGVLADGAIEHSLAATLYRSDDMARCIYHLRLDVSRPVEYSRFVILQIGADTYGYTAERKMAVGNEQGLLREWATEWGGNCYRTTPALLAGRLPWVSLHEAVSRDTSKSGAWANRGLVIRSWQARLGGKDCGPWFAEHGVSTGGVDTSTADILPPEDTTRLEPGDFVDAVFEHVVVPQFAHDYYGPNESLRQALARDENSWRMVYREAVGNDLGVKATIGQVEHLRPVVIRAAENRAEFVIRGGKGYVPITIRGLATYRAPRLELRGADGNWQAIDQTVHGNDFWQTDFDPESQTWEITFSVPGDTPDDLSIERVFRFSVE